MAFYRSSLLISKFFLINALSKCSLYPSLFHLSLTSMLFSIFLLCFCILRKPVVFDFIIRVNFFKRNYHSITKKSRAFYYNFEYVSKLRKDAKQLATIVCFSLENINKHGFFQILSF